MKFEKLSENKIRIIVNNKDWKNKNIQTMCLELLSRAKEEAQFDTSGYNILIETFLEDEIYIFTITKYIEESKKNIQNKKPTLKKPHIIANSKLSIYKFKTFDDFCNLCEFLHIINIKYNNLFEKSNLYKYNDKYYIIIENYNIKNKNYKIFNSTVLEFSEHISNAKAVNLKIKEYGKLIIEKNAIQTGLKFL